MISEALSEVDQLPESFYAEEVNLDQGIAHFHNKWDQILEMRPLVPVRLKPWPNWPTLLARHKCLFLSH